MRIVSIRQCLAVFLAIVVTVSAGCGRKETQQFKIGAILPLSGPPAQYGKWLQEGLELAREEINDKGGINGKPLEIIYEDDQAKPQPATNAMRKLAEIDKVPVVFGSWASSSVLAQAPIAEKDKVVVMAVAASPKIRDAGDFTFRIFPDGSYYMEALADYSYNKLGLRKISTIYVNNDFGIDLAAKFKEYFEASGGKVVSENGFEQGKTDLRAQLLLARASNPDAIFMPAYTEIGYALKQATEIDIHTQFLAAATFENADIISIAKNAAEGVVYPHHFDSLSSDPVVKDYQARYKNKFGHLSEGFAALAYDGLTIISSTLSRCNSDSSCIKTALYGTKMFQGVTGKTSFDDHGDVIKPIVIKTVAGGEFVLRQ